MGDSTERVVNVPVTCRFFSTIGIEPVLGRQFLEEECRDDRPVGTDPDGQGSRAVLISHHLPMHQPGGWRTHA